MRRSALDYDDDLLCTGLETIQLSVQQRRGPGVRRRTGNTDLHQIIHRHARLDAIRIHDDLTRLNVKGHFPRAIAQRPG